MDETAQMIPGFEDCIDDDGCTNLYEVSTVLVAHILEVKKRASEMELIFCKSIYPAFQSKTKCLQKKIMDAVKNNNEEWAKRESSILQQIEDLRCEKLRAHEEVKQLKFHLEEANKELTNKEELFRKSEHEKVQLLARVESLKEQLSNKTEEVAEGKRLQEKLLQQIDFKDQNLLTEQSKKKSLLEEFCKLKDNYKHLKSQYNFLLSKIGDGKSSSPSPCSNKRSPQDSKHREKEIPNSVQVKMESEDIPSSRKPMTNQNVENNPASEKPMTNQDVENNPASKKRMTNQIAQFPSNVNTKSEPTSECTAANYSYFKPPTFKKRSTSSWRETRNQEENLRDDFLNTPIENARNLLASPEEEVQLDDIKFNISDDETQEIIIPNKQSTTTTTTNTNNNNNNNNNSISVMGPSVGKGYKYVEPVRKKSEREKLKGVECKQCKKFYDAVLGDDDKGNGDRNMRCEHHEGVSRHRYKYAPPMTPEGFWNIGFETEM